MALTEIPIELSSTPGIVDNSNATAITIDSSENVGIGQAASDFSNWRILEIKGGTAGAMLNFENSSSTRVSTLAYDDGSDSLRIQNFLANPITFETSNLERFRIDASGNAGLGVVPSAWSSSSTALQIGSLALEDYTVSGANVSNIMNNAFRNSSGNVVYKETDFASSYGQYNGEHLFNVAASGTAGNTISFTRAMTIRSSGNVGIGGSNADYTLTVKKDVDDYIAKIENDGNSTSSNGLWVDTRWNTATNTVFNVTTNSGSTPVITAKGDAKVGIGTTSPDSRLVVQSLDNTLATDIFKFTSLNGSAGLKFGYQRIQQIGTSSPITFNTGGSESMRLTADGDVCLGSTGVIRGSSQTGVSIEAEGRLYLSRGTSTGGFSHLVFYNGNGLVGTVTTSGSATAYNTSSDQRLKENIADADDAGSKIDAIQVRKFDWKADGSHQDYGMVAQELQSVAPEAVSGDADSEEMMGVDYSKLVPMMLKEIQSLRARIAALES